ncbi:alkaline phosphatase family protein [Bradyrhizobium sp. SEMIA]|uniref:alkaline phosphatase family protein n=1 Tax=Bradyrhizobium sp. SEMIA TaxID=2597515 RepID=UPI0022400661|nr:alkaline phosphatase family protein [Bradyrhizobium sp. SEMIA]
MNKKILLSMIAAMSLATSLAGVATPVRAGDDDRDFDNFRNRDHGGGHHGHKSKQVVLISLDGAKPNFIQQFIEEGVLPRDGALARLSRHGAVALQNVTASPSLTAVSHIEIATGSNAVHNDIPSNTFQAAVAPISSSISGFAAPIGGYQESPLGPSPHPTAEPLWVQLRQQGKKVATATWPGGDGADIFINGTVVQSAQRPASSTTPCRSARSAASPPRASR